MRNQQEQRRNRIVQFFERWKHRRNDWKSMTAYHFMDQSFPKSTIYSVSSRFERNRSIGCKRRSERNYKNGPKKKRCFEESSELHITKLPFLNGSLQRDSDVASHKFCICRTFRRFILIMCRKRVKVPKYKEIAKIL